MLSYTSCLFGNGHRFLCVCDFPPQCKVEVHSIPWYLCSRMQTSKKRCNLSEHRVLYTSTINPTHTRCVRLEVGVKEGVSLWTLVSLIQLAALWFKSSDSAF